MNNTNDTAERSVASDGSVAWPSVGMISENRLRELMAYVGLLYSKSLLAALRQCDMEARLDVAARLRLTDAERDDLRVWRDECLRQASTATEGANEELAERWQGRAKRAAAMIERLGGGR